MDASMVTAFCPGHISGYFRKVGGESAAATGSIGAGIVISDGVTATVSPSDVLSIRVMSRKRSGSLAEYSRSSPPLTYVLEKLGITVSVVTECNLPIGAGFGLSAAALLATLTAVNRCNGLGLSPRDIALLAHESEVIHRTGLGDVSACQGGGRVVRLGPGIDGKIVRSFDLPGSLYAVSFGPISTPSVLGSPEQMERVSEAFPASVPENAEDFFLLSRGFAERSGLLTPEAGRVIRDCEKNGIPASMTMLGNGVFAWGRDAPDILSPYGDVYTFAVAGSGARILEERP